jgi:hypothetical protein
MNFIEDLEDHIPGRLWQKNKNNTEHSLEGRPQQLKPCAAAAAVLQLLNSALAAWQHSSACCSLSSCRRHAIDGASLYVGCQPQLCHNKSCQ